MKKVTKHKLSSLNYSGKTLKILSKIAPSVKALRILIMTPKFTIVLSVLQ